MLLRNDLLGNDPRLVHTARLAGCDVLLHATPPCVPPPSLPPALPLENDPSPQTVNVRTVMGMMGISTETLLGKLRIRLATLATGKLHTVDLPLQVGVSHYSLTVA